MELTGPVWPLEGAIPSPTPRAASCNLQKIYNYYFSNERKYIRIGVSTKPKTSMGEESRGHRLWRK
jgi:hypothetical protein